MSLSLSYDEYSPVECYKLRLVSVLFIFMFILSITFNSLLLWTFFTFKDLRLLPLNLFVIALTINNLSGTISEFPFVIISNFYCRFVLKDYYSILMIAYNLNEN